MEELERDDTEREDGDTSNRGFASMDEDKQREIASKGGKSQGKENNPGNFANDREKAAAAGRVGGQTVMEADGHRMTTATSNP
jgi:general stress protein YciG